MGRAPTAGRITRGSLASARPSNNIAAPLPSHPNAIDAAIHVATGVMTDGSTCHRTSPEHDACPCDAMGGITDVLAVHDRLGWRWIESETCKPQQDACSNPGDGR